MMPPLQTTHQTSAEHPALDDDHPAAKLHASKACTLQQTQEKVPWTLQLTVYA
jgi:hypothetical protein